MTDVKSIITQNRKLIKSENLVTLSVWYCNDAELGQDYNHEYTISNELTGTSHSYSQCHFGGYFMKYAEDQYTAHVNSNQLIIERVKACLSDQSNKTSRL